MLWIQTVESREDVRACGHCGRMDSVMSPRQELELKLASLDSPNAANALLDEMEPPTEDGETCVCGTYYCSLECKTGDADHVHICLGQIEDENHPLYQFKLFAFGVGFYDEFVLAQKVLARLIHDNDQMKHDLIEFLQSNTFPVPCFDDDDEDDIIETSWKFLSEGIAMLQRPENNKLFHDLWPNVVKMVWSRSLTIDVKAPTPLQKLCFRLSQQPLPGQMKIGGIIADGLRARMENLNQDDDDEHQHGHGHEHNEECCHHEHETFILTVERLLAEPERYIDGLSILGIFEDPELLKVSHSCVPSLKFTWADEKGRINPNQQILYNGDMEKSVCFIDDDDDDDDNNGLTVEDRQEMLSARGFAPCTCCKCLFEQGDASSLHDRDLEVLLEHLQAKMKLDLALQVIEEMLSRNSESPLALYTKIRILGWNDQWGDASQLLRLCQETFKEAADGEFVKKIHKLYELEQLFAFSPDQVGEAVSDLNIGFNTVEIDEDPVLISKRGVPTIPVDICAKMVHEAEAHAAKHSWTSQRHYSVPTTDIPVHEIPAASELLAQMLKDHLYPVMGTQYGKAPSSFRVIDAFIVKYSAEKQFYLPVHTDQSQYSMTIALNDDSEYGGGGTFFVDLNRSLNCQVGGVVSFPGHLCHGGAAVSSGVRYIVALFMYSIE